MLISLNKKESKYIYKKRKSAHALRGEYSLHKLL